jgi:hypothetical protein
METPFIEAAKARDFIVLKLGAQYETPGMQMVNSINTMISKLIREPSEQELIVIAGLVDMSPLNENIIKVKVYSESVINHIHDLAKLIKMQAKSLKPVVERVRTKLMTYTCNAGHTLDTMFETEGCKLCDILAILRKNDAAIVPLQMNFTYMQVEFEFQCSAGHQFVAMPNNCDKGCRTCNTLEVARKKHGPGDILTVDNTQCNTGCDYRLRFHCNKILHNPLCDNPACKRQNDDESSHTDSPNDNVNDNPRDNPRDNVKDRSIKKYVNFARDYDPSCTNFVPCDNDFYATQNSITKPKANLLCETAHGNFHPEIIESLRIFELIFDDRFDDPAPKLSKVGFTGYNARLKLAFIINGDGLNSKHKPAATKWCKQNKITFMWIHYVSVATIVTQLFTLGVIGVLQNGYASEIEFTKKIEKQLADLNARGKLFVNRIMH